MNITGGKLNSIKIKVPDYENIKPTLSKTRQGIFNTLATLIDFENKNFLDMFAGSGIIGFEAFSRGFNVSFIEKHRKTFESIKYNCKQLNIPQNVFYGNSVIVLKKIEEKFDVIYIDPPYESNLYEQSLTAIKDTNILNDNGIIILEYPADKNINFDGYNIIKIKDYADKQITYIKK